MATPGFNPIRKKMLVLNKMQDSFEEKKSDYGYIKIEKSAVIKKITDIFPQLAAPITMNTLNETELSIRFQINGIQFPMNIQGKKIIILSETAKEYDDVLYCEYEGNDSVSVYKSWVKDIQEEPVYFSDKGMKFYKDSPEYKDFLKKISILGEKDGRRN